MGANSWLFGEVRRVLVRARQLHAEKPAESLWVHYRRGELAVSCERHLVGFSRAVALPLPMDKTDNALCEWDGVGAAQRALPSVSGEERFSIGRIPDCKEESTVSEFKTYRRAGTTEMRPYQPGEDVTGISISEKDKVAGSPKQGDYIARNPVNHDDRWLVSAEFFASARFEVVA